jgi:SulP family sulfate permease
MHVLIDVSQAHFWDITAVAALEKVVQRFKAHNITVDVAGLNQASSTLIGSLDSAVV